MSKSLLPNRQLKLNQSAVKSDVSVVNPWHKAFFFQATCPLHYPSPPPLSFHHEWYHTSVGDLRTSCFLSFLPQEKEGEVHRGGVGGWASPGVCPSSLLAAGHQGHALASPLCPAAVPQLAGESHRQRRTGAGWREEGRLRDPEENGEGKTLASPDQHSRAPQGCRRPGGPYPQFGRTRGRCRHHQRCDDTFSDEY